jgi:hypothetical protein
VSLSKLEGDFRQAKHSQRIDAIRSDDFDFDFANATRVDPDRSLSSPDSVCSFSRQHCLSFQFLEPEQGRKLNHPGSYRLSI